MMAYGLMMYVITGIFAVGLTSEKKPVLPPSPGIEIYDAKTDYFENPIGMDARDPAFSWKINGRQRDTRQTAYRIQVSVDSVFTAEDLLWDTGKTASEKSVHVAYEGPDLQSGRRYYWRARVWDNHGNTSPWSEAAWWEMGLLHPEDWKAQWIEPGLEEDITQPQPCPYLRKEFTLDEAIVSARVYITSHGLYEMKINGRNVGDQLFTPGWTSYNKRLQYQTYDITDLLKPGKNAAGVTLGDGWYRGWIAFGNQRNFYGERLGLLAHIEVTYADGHTDVIGTDSSWKASTGPIRMSDIYDGEIYDARMEKKGWARPGYDDSGWSGVKVANYSKELLVAPEGPPVRKIQEIKPLAVFTTPEGDTVVDMGQNMVGWVRLNVEGPRGTTVTLQHTEVLTKEGNFYTENLRAAAQKNTYILSGGKAEVYEPHFTFQGFRYVRVQGYPGELTPDKLTGIVIHSDMTPTGHFESSNALVNQLQHNIVWGQKGNFLDVPTDCPQRDERLGWTGDIQVFAETACYNMDAAGFLAKWLRDLAADQPANGSVPYVVPNVLGEKETGASGWADASVIVPWTMYQAYGDVRILRDQYKSMKGWVEYMKKRAAMDATTYLWDNNFTFGDWLSFNSTSADYPGAYTDKDLISTAYFARSTDLLQRSAEILGKKEDAAAYAALLDKIREAFRKEYVTPSGRVMSNTQTAYLLALQFDLLPEDVAEKAVSHLIALIDKRGHLTTGFLGTPHLNPVLSQYGYTGEAYELLLRKEYPSWLYPVTMGATTIWERWDGIKPDSTFQYPGMNSFNHYAYGAIGEWLYGTVAGIEPVTPGYHQIAIHPHPGGGLSYARSLIHTLYGKVESAWEISGNTFSLTVEIPVNTSAAVTLPGATRDQVMENGRKIAAGNGITGIAQSGKDVTLALGSGRYRFSYPLEQPNEFHQAVIDKNRDYSKETKVGELLAHKKTRMILQDYLPELLQSPWLSQVMGFSLERAAASLPEGLRVSPGKLGEINRELESLEK